MANWSSLVWLFLRTGLFMVLWKGILLALARAEIRPDEWVANMLSIAATPSNLEAITWIIAGILGVTVVTAGETFHFNKWVKTKVIGLKSRLVQRTPAEMRSGSIARGPEADTLAPQNAKRDAWVLNALHFIAFGTWKIQDGSLAPGQGFDLIRASRDLEQAALDGDVPIWGKAPPSNKYVPIDAGMWEHIEIREKSLLDGDPTGVYARRKHGDVLPAQYRQLKTSKAKVEEWHAANTSA